METQLNQLVLLPMQLVALIQCFQLASRTYLINATRDIDVQLVFSHPTCKLVSNSQLVSSNLQLMEIKITNFRRLEQLRFVG